MNTKKCNKCGEIKPLAEFNNTKRAGDGKQTQCRVCSRQYYYDNKETALRSQKKRYQANKETILGQQKKYYQANKETILEKQKQCYQANWEVIAERKKQYYQANKDAAADYSKEYRKKNWDALLKYKRQYKKQRRATDPLFKLVGNIRARIGSSFRNGGFNKKSKTAAILGCTFKEYYKHIESQFKDGMSWQRMDEIHIDHRLPLSAANTEAELLVLNHHRNLQPMWAAENLAKSDSYCPDELAAYLKKHLPT